MSYNSDLQQYILQFSYHQAAEKQSYLLNLRL